MLQVFPSVSFESVWLAASDALVVVRLSQIITLQMTGSCCVAAAPVAPAGMGGAV